MNWKAANHSESGVMVQTGCLFQADKTDPLTGSPDAARWAWAAGQSRNVKLSVILSGSR